MAMRPCITLLSTLLSLFAFWLVFTTAAWGHELGPFQVYGTFLRSGAFQLDVKIDDEHLAPDQLGGPSRPTRYGRIAGLNGLVEQRFGRFLSDLADSLTISFDGVPVRPTLAMDPESAGGPAAAGGGLPSRATMRVAGWIPGGARSFTFASSLRIKSYPLVLHCEEDESSTWRWVAGGETSPAYELARRVVPPPSSTLARRCFATGFDHVLPHGPAPLLLAAAIFLLARRLRTALLMLAALALGQGLGLALALRGAAPVRPALLETLLALAVAAVAMAGLRDLPPSLRPRLRPPAAPANRSPARLSLAVLVPLTGTAALLLVGALFGIAFAQAAPALPAAPLTPPQVPAAAAGFTLGAAAAELAVVAVAFVLVGLPFRDKTWYRGRVVVPICCLIAVISLYWSLSGLLF